MATILCVEDYVPNARLIKDLLESHGHTVSVAEDGVVGYEMAIAQRPDLIITDMQMPRISGWELIPLLLGTTRFRRVPILIVTVMVGVGDPERHRLMDLPIQSKPIETRRFSRTVAWLLAWAASQPPAEPSDDPTTYPFYFSKIPDELRAEAYQAGVY